MTMIDDIFLLDYFDVQKKCLTVKGFAGSFQPTTIAIPEQSNGKPIVAISAEAFCDCSSIETIRIPDSVLSIGASAFKDCRHLRLVTFYKTSQPSGILEIEARAFSGCLALEQFNSDVHVAVAKYAFFECRNMHSFNATVVSADKHSFQRCQSITTMSFGRNAQWEDNSFMNCKHLSHLHFSCPLAKHMLNYPYKLRFLDGKVISCPTDFNYLDLAYYGASITIE